MNWFRKLYREYGLFAALMYAHYNAKHYNLDGTYRQHVFMWGRNRIDRRNKNMRRNCIIKVTAKRKSTFASILGVKKEVTSSSAQALAAIA